MCWTGQACCTNSSKWLKTSIRCANSCTNFQSATTKGWGWPISSPMCRARSSTNCMGWGSWFNATTTGCCCSTTRRTTTYSNWRNSHSLPMRKSHSTLPTVSCRFRAVTPPSKCSTSWMRLRGWSTLLKAERNLKTATTISSALFLVTTAASGCLPVKV